MTGEPRWPELHALTSMWAVAVAEQDEAGARLLVDAVRAVRRQRYSTEPMGRMTAVVDRWCDGQTVAVRVTQTEALAECVELNEDFAATWAADAEVAS